MMENLSLDLVFEILNRLPVKSFLQCRRVSKIWRNLLGKSKTAINWIQAQSASYHPSLRLKLYYSKMALSLVMTLKLQLQRNYGVLKAQKELHRQIDLEDVIAESLIWMMSM
ncbi:uncharacterized protein LOC113330012 [Papaver somniferum]|uniref:uncharacterized protein LOC113330012 n=1 Tax=Papaver somniferum TaxID=3469 RepID=UPI000E703ABE|nr:uncharacterized protein LOC113330012 [Papaver somniferum]